HSNQAWLTALMAIVDSAAVISLSAKDDLRRQGCLTFAMGRHDITDIAIVFGLQERSARRHPDEERLPERDFAALQQILRSNPRLLDADFCTRARLQRRRQRYEPQAAALSEYF